MTIFEIIVLSALFILLASAVVSGIVILYIGYKISKAYKLLQEDRVVNVTILPSIDGEVDIFDR